MAMCPMPINIERDKERAIRDIEKHFEGHLVPPALSEKDKKQKKACSIISFDSKRFSLVSRFSDAPLDLALMPLSDFIETCFEARGKILNLAIACYNATGKDIPEEWTAEIDEFWRGNLPKYNVPKLPKSRSPRRAIDHHIELVDLMVKEMGEEE